MKWTVSRQEFETLIEEALLELPEEFLSALENIVVVAEDEPAGGDMEVTRDDGGPDELLGIFRGIALPDKSFSDIDPYPASIVIFRGPILRSSDSREEAVAEIRDTVIHELGHYFGLDDDEMTF